MAAFSFPQNPSNGDTTTNSATGLTYVFVAIPLWITLWLTSTLFLVALASTVDFIAIIASALLFSVVFTVILVDPGSFHFRNKEWYFSENDNRAADEQTDNEDIRVLLVVCLLFVLILVAGFLYFSIFLTIFFSAFLTLRFSLMTFLGTWLNYPVQTIFIVSWAYALIVELRKVSKDYYAPLQTVWKVYIVAVRKMVFDGDNCPKKQL